MGQAGEFYNLSRWKRLRLVILERDGWVCGVCRRAIDPAARPGSRWAAAVDHVVPILEGGDRWDPANLRACHVRCNSDRVHARRRIRERRTYRPPRAW